MVFLWFSYGFPDLGTKNCLKTKQLLQRRHGEESGIHPAIGKLPQHHGTKSRRHGGRDGGPWPSHDRHDTAKVVMAVAPEGGKSAKKSSEICHKWDIFMGFHGKF